MGVTGKRKERHVLYEMLMVEGNEWTQKKWSKICMVEQGFLEKEGNAQAVIMESNERGEGKLCVVRINFTSHLTGREGE